mgnify:CR=1 FL=1
MSQYKSNLLEDRLNQKNGPLKSNRNALPNNTITIQNGTQKKPQSKSQSQRLPQLNSFVSQVPKNTSDLDNVLSKNSSNKTLQPDNNKTQESQKSL